MGEMGISLYFVYEKNWCKYWDQKLERQKCANVKIKFYVVQYFSPISNCSNCNNAPQSGLQDPGSVEPEGARISEITLTLFMVVTTCLQPRMYMRVALGIRDVLLSMYCNKRIPMKLNNPEVNPSIRRIIWNGDIILDW